MIRPRGHQGQTPHDGKEAGGEQVGMQSGAMQEMNPHDVGPYRPCGEDALYYWNNGEPQRITAHGVTGSD